MEAASRRKARHAMGDRSILVGVAGAVMGMLPWWASGARLPVQNLWSTTKTASEMPLAALPVNQYYLIECAALLIIGGAIVGLGVRATRRFGIDVNRGVAVGTVVGAQILAVMLSHFLPPAKVSSTLATSHSSTSRRWP